MKETTRIRTLFLSDIHLGSRGCQAAMLLDFLSRHDPQRIYLVGDIFDGWRLKRGWHWPQDHNDVVKALLARAHAGVPVIYIPGNHDEAMRRYAGTQAGGIAVRLEDCFTAADGRRFLVTHGDQFDVVVEKAKWLAHLGDHAYRFMQMLDRWLAALRGLWGGQYWSLSNWAKQLVKRAVNFIGKYEQALGETARRGGYDGVICGHVHKAALQRIGAITYVNCGDWVESCTAIVEDFDGTLRLIDWAAETRERAVQGKGRGRHRTPALPISEPAE